MDMIQDIVHEDHGAKPEKILQFGGGNFLRAFADWMIDDLNDRGSFNGSIVVCQQTPGGNTTRNILNEQEGNYTVIMRGIENGEPVVRSKLVTSISRCINAYSDYDELKKLFCSESLEVVISNTTEAGIRHIKGESLEKRPADSFPAKLTQLLHDRYRCYKGDGHGLLFLPTELIDENGTELKRIIIQYAKEWGLEDDFILWINKENHFANTLVDRIVTGYPADEAESLERELDYRDRAIVTCEPFDLWVIEGSRDWKDILPLGNGEGNVLWTEDVRPYKTRKVRILNGGHTSIALAGILSGHTIVKDIMDDPVFETFLRELLYEEVIPGINMSSEELNSFATEVLERFRNPFVKHRLLDISLNSCAKYAARCLPSLKEYRKNTGKIPARLAFSLAALIRFYRGTMTAEGMTGQREDGTLYPIRDSEQICRFFENVWSDHDNIREMTELTRKALGCAEIWGEDLTKIPGLAEGVCQYLKRMEKEKIEDIIWGIGKSSGSMRQTV